MSTPGTPGIHVDRDKETGVAVVTLDRPEKHNSITLDMARELAAVWRGFRYEDEVRAIVVTGAGGGPSAPGSTGRP